MTEGRSAGFGYAGLAGLFSISRPTVYRSLERTTALPALPAGNRPPPDIAEHDEFLGRTPGTEAKES